MATNIFAGSTVAADPTVMVATAEGAHKQIQAYRAALDEIARLIDSSKSFWVGEAGDAYRQVLAKELAQVQATLDLYAAYPGELLEFAGLYSASIAKAEEHVNATSTFQMQ